MDSNHNVEEKTIESDKNKIGNVKIVFIQFIQNNDCFHMLYAALCIIFYV